VALQSAVGDIHDQIPRRKASAGRIGGDGRRRNLPPGPRRSGLGAKELGPVLIAPEVTGAPSSGGRWAIYSVRAAVLVGGDAAEELLAGDDPVLLGQGDEAGGVGDVEEASGGDGAHSSR